MFRRTVMPMALAGALLLAAATLSEAQPGRPVLPYSSEAEALQAKRRSIEKEFGRIQAVAGRLATSYADLGARIRDFNRRWNANEAFGQQRSSGETHRRNYIRYWDTRSQLDRERTILKREAERLETARRGILADITSLQERVRRYSERVASSGGSGRGFGYDENAPKKR